MSSEIQTAILANAAALLDSANILELSKKRHHAAHLAAICLEECAKCLMHFESVQEAFDSRAKRSHFTKSELINFFYFVTGGLEVVFLLRYAMEEGLLGGTNDDQRLVLDDLLQFSGMIGDGSLSKTVTRYLEARQEKPELTRNASANNEIRKNSVYCDVIDGAPMSPIHRVSEKEIDDTLGSARLAVGLLQMAMNGVAQRPPRLKAMYSISAA